MQAKDTSFQLKDKVRYNMKNGKVFGKINILDFIVVLVVALLIVAATIKFGKFNNKTEESSTETIIYKIEVKNIRDFTVEAFQSGDEVYDSQTDIYIGKIINVEKNFAETYDVTDDGKTVLVNNPYKYDMILTIETSGDVEKDAYYANKTIELKLDSEKTIETKYAKTTGKICEINISK